MDSEAKGETHGSDLGSVSAQTGKRVCSYFKPSEEPAKKPRVGEEEGVDDDEEEDAAPDLFKELRAVSDCDSESEHSEEDFSSDDEEDDVGDLCDDTEEDKTIVRSLERQRNEILSRKSLAIPEESYGEWEQKGDRMCAYIVKNPYTYDKETEKKVPLVGNGMRVIGFRNIEPADQCADTNELGFFIMLGPSGFRHPVHAYAQIEHASELYDLVDAVKNNKDDPLRRNYLDDLLGLPSFFIPTRQMCEEFVRDPSHVGLDETRKVWGRVEGCRVMTPNTAIEEFLRSNNTKHSERALKFASGLKGFMKANYIDYKENTDSILSVLNELCEVQTEISLALKRSNPTKKAVKWNLANRLPGKYEALRLV
jgi:hypothetical protein